jgi:putative molybdopterin biosynthesis protein
MMKAVPFGAISYQVAEKIVPESSRLTVTQAAQQLGVCRNTVYALKNRGELGCYYVGRKLFFSQSDIDEYLARQHVEHDAGRHSENASGVTPLHSENASGVTPRHSENASGVAQNQPSSLPPYFLETCTINGDDVTLDLLANYLAQMGVDTTRSHLPTYSGLTALYGRRVSATAADLWDARSNSHNVAAVRRLLPGVSAVLVNIVRRKVGLIVARGNPLGLADFAGLAMPGLRLANHPLGSGERVLLDEQLQQLGIPAASLAGYNDRPNLAIMLARRIVRGEADVMIGNLRLTRLVEGVDFIPVLNQSYDLVLRRDSLDTLPARALLNLLQSGILRSDLLATPGYDTSQMGTVTTVD